MDVGSDEDERLLRQLQQHGEQFVERFGAIQKTGIQKTVNPLENNHRHDELSASEGTQGLYGSKTEEWSGIPEAMDLEINSVPLTDYSKLSSNKGPQASRIDRGSKKAFMSSFISRVGSDRPPISAQDGALHSQEEDLSNVKNDAILQKIIHTKLLSNPLAPDATQSPAQRKKVMAGRVEEAAGQAKLGKGEGRMRKVEENRHSKQIRDGMKAKKTRISSLRLAESKELGIYNPAMNRSYETEETKQHEKRNRGLRLGVGNFKRGTLHLSRREIESISKSTSHEPRRKRERKENPLY